MKRILLTLFSLALLTPAFAASVKDLEYRTNDNDTITIMRCNDYASGHLIIPATIDGKKVAEIKNNAFSYCSSLTSVTIPKGVTKIKGSAFFGCSSLTSVTIPSSVTEIWGSVFARCTSLTSVTIPKGVTKIGDYAFALCTSLTSVTIPEGVTEIRGSTFQGCSSLTSVTIPSSVTKIGEGAFLGCTAIEEMIFKGPPPHVVPLRDEGKQSLERECGISNPETLPATKGYYLPEHAEAWEKVLGGETGRWNNLQMEPLGGVK